MEIKAQMLNDDAGEWAYIREFYLRRDDLKD